VLLLALLAGASPPWAASAQDPAVLYIGAAALASVVPSFLLDLPQPDADRAFLKVSGGVFDAVDDENVAVDLLLEYQPGVTWHRIKPMIGVAGNTDGTVYGWISAGHDVQLGDRLVVNVNTGPAFYFGGASAKDLGSAAVLRSGFELGLRVRDNARVTASFHHMSHGKLLNPDWNPGTEVVALNVAWALN
jgi:hypothetical protein